MYLKELDKLQYLNCFIEEGVIVEEGAKILYNTIILGKSKVEKGAVIGPNSVIINSVIGSHSKVLSSWLVDSVIGKNCTIGPYANLRKDNYLLDDIRIGNFVELKNSVIKSNSKASHLAYIGDSNVGCNCNFGCGSITVNYDGKNKFKTEIGDNAFIGCNTNLVAPVKIDDNSFIACGSTITKDVPKNSLSIARSHQINKIDYLLKKDNMN